MKTLAIDIFDELVSRFSQRTARIAVIGLGHTGLPLAVGFAEAGFGVTGIEIDPSRVAQINEGRSYLVDLPDEQLEAVVEGPGFAGQGALCTTTGYDALREADVAIICVPTPLNKTHDPDLSYIIAAADGVAKWIHCPQLIILESTTYPGTTEEVVLPRLEATGCRVGEDIWLAFSPERADPGQRKWNVHNTPRVVGGITPRCLQAAQTLYETTIERVIPASSCKTAEMVKLLENTFRAVNIGLVNEIALICDQLNIDVWEVIDAASTKPYGYMPFYPGPGLGGHCIPVDPHYLAWKLRSLNYNARFIELASQVNFGMPRHVVNMISESLNRVRKPLMGSEILILGVAYKRNVADIRESPALDIIHLLQAKGAQVSYNDPYVPTLYTDGVISLVSSPLDEGTLKRADCVVVVTDHSTYDWPWIVGNSRLLIDTRNATKAVQNPDANIVLL